MARPERKFTEDEIEEIKELGPVLTHDQLAEYFSITAKTLREIFKRDERVFTAYTQSRMKAGMLAVNTLKDKAIIYNSNNVEEIYNIFKNFDRNESKNKDWNAYSDYSPEKVMDTFNEVFIKPLL